MLEQVLVSVLFTVGFAIRNSYQFRENAARNAKDFAKASHYNSLWHFAQAGVQLVVIYTIARYDGYTMEAFVKGTLFAGIFWLLFDGIVNTLGLQRSFFYVGQTAAIDKFFRRIAPNRPSRAMAIAKIFFIVMPIIILVTLFNPYKDDKKRIAGSK